MGDPSFTKFENNSDGGYLTGWMAYYRSCSLEAVKRLGVIDAHIRGRIEAIIVRQKKRPRFLLPYLMAMGVSGKAAAGVRDRRLARPSAKRMPASERRSGIVRWSRNAASSVENLEAGRPFATIQHIDKRSINRVYRPLFVGI